MVSRKSDSDTARDLRRAQRATRARVKAAKAPGATYEKILPRSFRAPSIAAQTQYARDVQSGKEPRPDQGTPEGNQLARMASLARWNKADPSFLGAFKDYFYHNETQVSYRDIDDEQEAALWKTLSLKSRRRLMRRQNVVVVIVLLKKDSKIKPKRLSVSVPGRSQEYRNS